MAAQYPPHEIPKRPWAAWRRRNAVGSFKITHTPGHSRARVLMSYRALRNHFASCRRCCCGSALATQEPIQEAEYDALWQGYVADIQGLTHGDDPLRELQGNPKKLCVVVLSMYSPAFFVADWLLFVAGQRQRGSRHRGARRCGGPQVD